MAAGDRSTGNGHVQRESFTWGESLNGPRDALIAEGTCKAHWFPRAPRPRYGGKVKRTFRFVEGDRLIWMRDCGARWCVSIEVPVEERRRREAQEELERREQLEAAELAAELALRRATLAPMPEMASKCELQHLQLLRTMSTRSRDHVMDYTRICLAWDARRGELAVPQRRLAPRLQLVVDNTGSQS